MCKTSVGKGGVYPGGLRFILALRIVLPVITETLLNRNLAYSADVGLLCMLHPGMGPLSYNVPSEGRRRELFWSFIWNQTGKFVVRAEDLPRAGKLPCAQPPIRRAEFEKYT